MVTISLIPILGLISLIAVALAALSWRGSSLARATQSVDEAASTILHKDLENDQQLVANLLNGTPIDECFSQHADIRRRLLPSAGERNWTIDDIQIWKKSRKQHEADSINRRMMVPTFGIVLAIITVCVVSVVLLYEFQVSSPPVFDELSSDSNTITAPAESVDSIDPAMANNAAPPAIYSMPTNNSTAPVIQPNSPGPEDNKPDTVLSPEKAEQSSNTNPNPKETAASQTVK